MIMVFKVYNKFLLGTKMKPNQSSNNNKGAIKNNVKDIINVQSKGKEGKLAQNDPNKLHNYNIKIEKIDSKDKQEIGHGIKLKKLKQRQHSLEKLQRNNSISNKESLKLNRVKSDKNIRPKSFDVKNQKRKQVVVKIPSPKKQVGLVQNKKFVLQKQKVKASIPQEKDLVISQNFSQKDYGLTYFKPQFDKILLQTLEITDPIYDKYYDMISNDNDSFYVLNAIPQIKDFKKEQQKRNISQSVLTGRLSKISGIYDQFSVQTVISALKNKPIFYQNKPKVLNMKIILQTKFKVAVDIGFLQYAIQNDKLIILRIYISKIYRKMNYIAFVYLEVMKQLADLYKNVEKCAILIHDRNLGIVKFYKFMGFKIDRMLTDSRNQKVDYFQDAANKKKDFLAIYNKINTTGLL